MEKIRLAHSVALSHELIFRFEKKNSAWVRLRCFDSFGSVTFSTVHTRVRERERMSVNCWIFHQELFMLRELRKAFDIFVISRALWEQIQFWNLSTTNFTFCMKLKGWFCFLSKNTFIYHQFLFKIPSTITNWILLLFILLMHWDIFRFLYYITFIFCRFLVCVLCRSSSCFGHFLWTQFVGGFGSGGKLCCIWNR